MRLVALVWAGVLLAACTVEVEGAPCAVPGATADCPRDQACGNDRRCSARALACAASRCTPAVGGDCLGDPVGIATGTAYARRCVDSDPVCGAWDVVPCEAGLACGHQSGGATCECPPNPTRVLVVAPDGSPPGPPLHPSGIAAPAGCAFATLSDALDRAGALHALDPSGDVTVRAVGASAGNPRSFSATSGERFPLRLGAGIALVSDGPSDDKRYEIVYARPATGTVALALEGPGSLLAGFTIRNGDGGLEDAAVLTSCAVGPVFVSSIVVEGRGDDGARLGTGLLGSACATVVDGLEVRDVAEAAISWSASTLVIANSVLTRSGGAGIRLRGGTLEATGLRVAENAGMGIDAATGSKKRVVLARSRIVRNGDTGIGVAGGTASISRSTIFGNRATTGWSSPRHLWGITRLAGGIVLSEAVLETWAANRVYSNSGDQVLLLGGGGIFDGASGCVDEVEKRLLTSAIGCLDGTPAGVIHDPQYGDYASRYYGILGLESYVSALNLWWRSYNYDNVHVLPSHDAPSIRSDCESLMGRGWPIACGSEDIPADCPYTQ